MANNKIETNLAWLIISLSVFSNCLLFQTRSFLILGLALLFFTIILALEYDWKMAVINLLATSIYLLLSKISFVIYDPKVMMKFLLIEHLRQKIADYYDRIYATNTFASGLFKLIILNIHGNDSKQIYTAFTEISVIHMFVVSGFHLNLMFALLTFWNRKKETRFVNWIVFGVCSFYGLLLNLKFGIIRSLITLFLAKVQPWWKISAQQRLAIAVFLIVLLNQSAVQNYGFQMSCLGTLGCISGFKTKHKILDNVFTNLLAMILITPIIICMSHHFNAISFIVVVLFSPLFYVLIIYAWLFSWIEPIVGISLFFVNCFGWFFNLLAAMKMMIVVQQINSWYLIAYYWIVLSAFVFLNLKSDRYLSTHNQGLAIWN